MCLNGANYLWDVFWTQNKFHSNMCHLPKSRSKKKSNQWLVLTPGLPEELLEVLSSLLTQDMKPTWSLSQSFGQVSVLVKWKCHQTIFRSTISSHKGIQCDLLPFTKLQTGDLDLHTDRIPHQSVVIIKSRREPGKKKKIPLINEKICKSFH